jgi:hypothetical protein
MSTLVAQTISNGTVSTSSANVIQGSAKAWVNFNGSSAAIRASYNVSSITRIATGNYTINFTNALTDANYVLTGTTIYLGIIAEDNSVPLRTSSAIKIYTPQTNTGSPVDYSVVSISIFR